MNIGERFRENIKRHHLFSPKDKLLLAVSGGVDSVVLCELCKQSGYDFLIAHCNFQLRGEESERDERFVMRLGEKYEVAVKVKKFDTEKYTAEKKISVQEAARNLRYEWFAELIKNQLSAANSEPAPVYLVTAHHADDNAETVLMNFCRGTGLHGLTGIPVAVNNLRRPLLPFSKQELTRFAQEHKLEWVEDSSNLSSKYTRNLFRNEIIPAIEKVYPQVKENLQDNINRFTEIEKLYKLSVAEIKNRLCKKKQNEIHIPVKQLMGYNNKALIYEIIGGYGFSEKQTDELLKLAASESGRYIQSPAADFRIIKHRHWFVISPVPPQQSEYVVIEQNDKAISFPGGMLHLEVTGNREPATGSHIACLDMKEIRFPLLLRKWKTGDYFYPLGMKKKKKLSRFFIDQKLSKADKEKIWVIEMNKIIIWVVGMRIDERFKIAPNTTNVLQFTFRSNT